MDTRMEERVYTDRQAARLTSLSTRRLARWDHLGIVKPSISIRAKYGRRRVYDFRDLLGLKVAAELSKEVRWLPELKKAIDHLRGLDYKDPLAEVLFWVWRGRIYFKEAQTIRAGRRPEQTIMPFVIPLNRWAADLGADLLKLDERQVGQIERRRGALGYKPVIAGTRIPVASIRRLVRDGLSEAQVLKFYPDLTREDVRAALAA
jgi:uncharacterized protein (DUF433 family)